MSMGLIALALALQATTQAMSQMGFLLVSTASRMLAVLLLVMGSPMDIMAPMDLMVTTDLLASTGEHQPIPTCTICQGKTYGITSFNSFLPIDLVRRAKIHRCVSGGLISRTSERFSLFCFCFRIGHLLCKCGKQQRGAHGIRIFDVEFSFA